MVPPNGDSSDDPAADIVDISVEDTTIRAVDRRRREVEIDATGLDRPAPELDLPIAPDAAIAGRMRALSLPLTHVWTRQLDEPGPAGRRKFGEENGHLELDDGSYVVAVDASMRVLVRFDGPAVLDEEPDGRFTISFPHPRAVTVGFASSITVPRHTVTVPKTPAGLAEAVTASSMALTVEGPRRATGLPRQHPPRLTFGETTDIPDAVTEYREDTGIEIVAPDRLAAPLFLAPLAYYLGADVSVADRESAVLRAPAVDLTYEFDPMPDLQYQAMALLRRQFFLDTLVHFATSPDLELNELDVLETLSLAPDDCATATIAARLDRYLDVRLDRLEPILPDWHYVAYLEPTIEHARALPYLLVNLAALYTPSAAPRPPEPGPSTPSPFVGDRPHRPFVAWLADGTPPGAFHASTTAFENERRYLDRQATPERIVVVDDGTRTVAADRIANGYRTLDRLDATVIRRPETTGTALRSTFETSADLVHYVGRSASDLADTDGVSAPQESSANARLFVLDAPQSHDAGRALVRSGSVAGIVRTDDARGGADPAPVVEVLQELLAGGCTLDRGLRLARSIADEDVKFAVVGDGIQQLSQSEDLYPVPQKIEPLGGGEFRVVGYPYVPLGGLIWSPHAVGPSSSLANKPVDPTLDAGGIRALLEHSDDPLFYDGELHWSEDLEGFARLL